MKSKLSEKKLKELLFFRDLNLIIVDYFCKLEPEIKMVYNSILKAFETNELCGMRETFNETIARTDFLTNSQKEELNAILREKLGTDLNELKNKTYKKIKRVIQRGKIKTDEEYYLLKERIEEIYDDEGKREEVEELETLLLNYENSKRV